MYDESKYFNPQNHKIFKPLNRSQIKELFIKAKLNKAHKGESINFLSFNEPRIFFLKKGSLKIVSINEEGNEITKEILLKGDLFGEISLIADKNTNEYAKVLTKEVSIYSFLLSDFEYFLLRNPILGLYYTKFIGFKMKQFKNNYADLISKDAKTRLLLFLKDWALREGIQKKNHYIINNYLTQNDIAQIIYSSRQTITLILNELKEKNIISYNRKEIILKEISKL